jgi:hypothetical protein
MSDHWEVQGRKRSEQLRRPGVIGASGRIFIVKIPDGYLLTVVSYLCMLGALPLRPAHTLVAGGARDAGFSSIPAVLGESDNSQVGASVVQAVMVDMVNESVVGDAEYLAMHTDLVLPCWAALCLSRALGIISEAAFRRIPSVLRKPRIVLLVNYCIFALRQPYPAEGVAIAYPAIAQ